MRTVGRGGVLLGLVLISSLFAWTASSNSAGAPQNAADTGCTCHNAQPDTGVTVGVQGIPETYEAEKVYAITITVTGGPTPVPAVSQNQGGFAIKVSDGTLLADDGITVTGGTFATHSAETNNQRSWALEWAAPAVATSNVTISVVANSVNGDGTNAGDLDRWNRATFTITPMAGGGGNTTQSPSATPTDAGTPGVSFVLGALIVASAVFLRRRQA